MLAAPRSRSRHRGICVRSAAAASAHAHLLGAVPAQNSLSPASPSQVTLCCSEPLATGFSSIEVLDASGGRVDRDDSRVATGDRTRLSVTLAGAPLNGTYTVAWRDVSTVHGHSLRGSFSFFVGERPAGASALSTEATPLLFSNVEPVVRWLVLLGALAAAGSLLFEWVALRPAPGLAGHLRIADLDARIGETTLRIAWGSLALFVLASWRN